MQQQYYDHLVFLLTKLKDGPGHFIIQNGSFAKDNASNTRYCQLYKDDKQNVFFEAQSHYMDPSIPTFYATLFKKIGFDLEQDMNYIKEISLSTADNIAATANEVVYIFEKIYGQSPDTVYDFDDEINPAATTGNEIETTQKAKKFPSIVFMVVGVLIVLFFLARNRNTESMHVPVDGQMITSRDQEASHFNEEVSKPQTVPAAIKYSKDGATRLAQYETQQQHPDDAFIEMYAEKIDLVRRRFKLPSLTIAHGLINTYAKLEARGYKNSFRYFSHAFASMSVAYMNHTFDEALAEYVDVYTRK